MDKPTIEEAEEIKQTVIKEAEDREVFKKIKYICQTLGYETQPLPGSGVIIFYNRARRFAKAFRAENEGRQVFAAKERYNHQPVGQVDIQIYRTGAWVCCLEETYDSVQFRHEKGDVRKIMRDFWPLEGDWNEP